jgi:phage major head subunit gpT-like protein
MAFNPTVIEKGLNARFAQEMARFQEARTINPGLMRAALEIPSTSAYEKLGWFGAMPAVQQWLGELNAKEFAGYDYTIKNLDWATAVPINENDINDDQTASLQTIPRLLVRRIMAHPMKLMVDLLINGDVNTAYDGKAFFSDVSAPRLIDNLLAGTGVTVSALETDLIAALVAMSKFTDDQGEPLNLIGDLIVCPKALEYNFKKLVESKASPTATAGVDTYNPFAQGFEVIGDPRLDADDANDWYLLCTNEAVKPFVYSNRQAARPAMEKKNLTKTWVYSADYRGAGGYGIPHLAVKTVNT